MNRHACTIIYNMYRVDALRTPSRLRAGFPILLQWRGRYDFFQAQDQPSVTTHVRVGNRVFSHSLDIVSKMYTLYTCTVILLPAQYQKRYLSLSLIVFVVSSDVLNFHGHSQCPCINVARLSVLHNDTIVVDIPGRS